MRLLLLGAMLGVALAGPAFADQASDSAATCGDRVATPDQRIAACSWLIPSGLLDPKGLATVYFNRGNAFGAKADYDHAIQDFDQAARLNPGDAPTFAGRGLAYAHKNDFDHAIDDFSQSLQLRPGDAEVLADRAQAYRRKGDFDHAIQDDDQAIRLNPGDYSAFNNRGLAYGAKGDLKRAIQDYNQALQLKPDYVRALRNRGLAYAAMPFPDRAIPDLDKVIALNPTDAAAFSSRGYSQYVLGKSELAFADLDQAIRLRPNDAEAYYRRARAHVGNHAYSNQVEYDQTIQDYTQAIRLKPDYAEAYFGRCQMLLLHDKALAAARSDCLLAATYAPRDTMIRWSLGQIDFQLGRFADAAADGDAVLKIDPKDAASLFLRGAARRRTGDTTGGDADIAAAKALHSYIAEEQKEFGIIP